MTKCRECIDKIIIGGSAYTNWECKICGKKATEGHTNIPMLCGECSRDLLLCERCGKSIRG
jgi:hypothetical protein